MNEIRSLRSALTQERQLRSKLEADHDLKLLKQLEPIPVFKKDSEIDKEVISLEKECIQLMNDMNHFTSLPKVVDLSKVVPASFPTSLKDDPATFLLDEVSKLKSFEKRIELVKERYYKEMMKRNPDVTIKTDFTTFPAPGAKKILEGEGLEVVAKLVLPCEKDDFVKENKLLSVPVDVPQLCVIKNEFLKQIYDLEF